MPEFKKRKPRRTFTDNFKSQIVLLYQNGKRKCDILNEYDISPSLLDKWIKQSDTTGSFKEQDNLTPEQLELRELRKRNKQLEMENDILKQAALILGRK
jgi:transposase